MSKSTPKLNFYFLADPSAHDPAGAIADEAKVVDHIPVMNTADFVRRITQEAQRTGGKIHRMTISGHGGKSHFRIGHDRIDLESPYLPVLALIAHLFAPDAEVTIAGCEVGQSQPLLNLLSRMWGGIKVIGWTGDWVVWEWKYWGQVYPTGERVVCMKGKCEVPQVRSWAAPLGFPM